MGVFLFCKDTMTFRTRANIDPNSHKGLILSNSITNGLLVATGLSLTNAQPMHVAIVDGDGSQVTTFPVSGSVTIGAGTSIIGAVVLSGHATAGTGLSTIFDADGDNTAQSVKGTPGRLYFIEVSNPNAADAYLQLFDLATGSVTVGATTPKLSLLVPAGDGTKDGAMDKVFTIGLHFGTAITYACTTTATGSGDPTTGLVCNFGYV